MDKNKGLKIIGVGCMVAGVIIDMIQKQLDDKKLEDLVAKQVQKQLNKK